MEYYYHELDWLLQCLGLVITQYYYRELDWLLRMITMVCETGYYMILLQ